MRAAAALVLALGLCACAEASPTPEQQAMAQAAQALNHDRPNAVLQAVAHHTPEGDLAVCGYTNEPRGTFDTRTPFVFRHGARLSRAWMSRTPPRDLTAICGAEWVQPWWPRPIA
jgi:hypothetical protein